MAAASYLRKTEDLKVISINDQSFDVDGIQCTPLGGLSYFRKIQSLKNCKKNGYNFVSYCLPADLMIVLAGCGNRSIMNLRGNLFKNYSYDFGVVGFIMAVLHLLLGVFFKKVFVLNESMRNQVKFLQGKVTVIPNFVDEENIKILKETS